MIPIENSVAGRVADIHHLLPDAGLYIVAEHFLRVRHQLMALPGATLDTVKRVMSHTQALGQCRNTLRKLGLKPVPEADTAGSARIVSQGNDLTVAAIASRLAARDLRPQDPQGGHGRRGPQHDALRRAVPRTPTMPSPMMARSSRPSCSACATYRRRSTRRWAGSRPTAST